MNLKEYKSQNLKIQIEKKKTARIVDYMCHLAENDKSLNLYAPIVILLKAIPVINPSRIDYPTKAKLSTQKGSSQSKIRLKSTFICLDGTHKTKYCQHSGQFLYLQYLKLHKLRSIFAFLPDLMVIGATNTEAHNDW